MFIINLILFGLQLWALSGIITFVWLFGRSYGEPSFLRPLAWNFLIFVILGPIWTAVIFILVIILGDLKFFYWPMSRIRYNRAN